MDYLINDEIFGNDNDELLQPTQFDSALWSDELIADLHNVNQFFNDQDFDVTQLSLSLDDDNKIQNVTQTSSNIFQVSPELFPRGVSPDLNQITEHNVRRQTRPITLVNKRKAPLDYRDTLNLGDSEPKIFVYDNGDDNLETGGDWDNFNMKHKAATFFVPKLTNSHDDRRTFVKIKRPDNITLFQIAPGAPNYGEKGAIERTKYSLSPSTSSPDSAIDCSTTNTSLNRACINGDPSFHSYNHHRLYDMKYRAHKDDSSYSARLAHCTRLFQSPIPQSGLLILTEEEKRTLLSEGYQIPSRLPLTKHEERNLKKVRRKIKNKISAQESRRKKKEYMEALEKKVEIYAQENNELRKKLESQENTNKSLLGQLRHLQQMLGRASSNTTSTCVMVFLLCFSLILVGLPEINQPMKLPQSVLIVGNIHKVGYGSLMRRERSHMTAMQRYFPPDIDGFVNTSFDNGQNILSAVKESRHMLEEPKGNEPLHPLESATPGQRKSILLGNMKEEEDECVQYGPRYLWWLLQSPTVNTDNSRMRTSTLIVERQEPLTVTRNIVTTIMVPTHPPMKNESTFLYHPMSWSNTSVERLRIAVTGIVT